MRIGIYVVFFINFMNIKTNDKYNIVAEVECPLGKLKLFNSTNR